MFIIVPGAIDAPAAGLSKLTVGEVPGGGGGGVVPPRVIDRAGVVATLPAASLARTAIERAPLPTANDQVAVDPDCVQVTPDGGDAHGTVTVPVDCVHRSSRTVT